MVDILPQVIIFINEKNTVGLVFLWKWMAPGRVIPRGLFFAEMYGADNRSPAASPCGLALVPLASLFHRLASSIGCSNVHRTFSLTPMPSQDATPQEAKLIGLVELMHASEASCSSTPV